MAALLLLFTFFTADAQSRKELEKKRDALDKQIRTTQALIEQARKGQQVTQQQLRLLEAQIAQREALIQAINGEMGHLEQLIRENEDAITSLNDDLETLRSEYARMVQFAYYNRSAYDRLSYVFAASSFAQGYKRSRYLGQLAEHRQRQAELIAGTAEAIAGRVAELRGLREEKVRLLGTQVDERKNLDKDRVGQKSALDDLKKEEARLRDQMNRQAKQRGDLDSAIRKAIEAEMRPKGGKAAPGGKLELSLTPEARELNSDFEKNKGKLPWPVEKGVITGRFGQQPHPVLKGIMIDLAGIDIATEKSAPVRAVFRGEVSSVIVIPGAGKAVVVSHGAYRTVYSNLQETRVTKGQKVETKQVVGTVLTSEDGSTAHLEIWKITNDGQLVKLDPALWIFRD
ncbi:MAG: peptidoglycan DD-metalloendopeptidase family protein [Flavobacteriales bacterium]|nr:peptidoglycan DD-metalloendopeptidase family protein [Flavobacteriales bacterium]